jgi:hypothetical protein
MERPLVYIALLALFAAAPLYAMDSLNMPTGNAMAPESSEANFIYINMSQKRSPAGEVKVDDLRYYKIFSGITDRLQFDVDHLDIKHAGDYTEANVYYTVLKERADRPKIAIGATNITSEDWIGGSDFGGNPDYDDISPFVVAAKTVLKSPKPSLENPIVRLHMGYGDNFHDEEIFGQVQMKLHPRFGVMAQTYKSMPTYGATFQAAEDFQVSAGTMDGNVFYRAGYRTDW